MEDLTGKQFGPYQIVAPLGEGGMAAVYKAYQPGMDRYVALKILPRHFAGDPQFEGRFEQEAKVLAKLQHPHILPVFDYGQADGYTYIVMPFLQSGDLTDWLRGQPLSLEQIRRVISQVGDALDYAHQRGLIHRDVKPSNVLMDERGNCLLTDFGIAKIVEGDSKLTATGGIIGTPIYMSPEQGLGEKLDGRSDIYSLGVMLYEMATGRVPYRAETPMAVIIKHMNDPLPPPRQINPTLPEAVERVILKAMAKLPQDRYPTAGELGRAIQAAIPETVTLQSPPLETAPTLAVGPAPSIVGPPPAPKSSGTKMVWFLAAAGGVVILLLLVCGLIGFWGMSSGGGGIAGVATRERNLESGETATPTLETGRSREPVTSEPTTLPIPETPLGPVEGTDSQIEPTESFPYEALLATPPPGLIFYDAFDNPALDGSFNQTQWVLLSDTENGGQAVQENGRLKITRQITATGLVSLIGLGYSGPITTATFFEADLMVASPQPGYAYLAVGPDWFTQAFASCTMGDDSKPDMIACYYAFNGDETAQTIGEDHPMDYGTWHTVRIAFDPATTTFTYYLDGELVDTYLPPQPEKLKDSYFTFDLGVGGTTAGELTGYMDNVRVGPVDQ